MIRRVAAIAAALTITATGLAYAAGHGPHQVTDPTGVVCDGCTVQIRDDNGNLLEATLPFTVDTATPTTTPTTTTTTTEAPSELITGLGFDDNTVAFTVNGPADVVIFTRSFFYGIDHPQGTRLDTWAGGAESCYQRTVLRRFYRFYKETYCNGVDGPVVLEYSGPNPITDVQVVKRDGYPTSPPVWP